MNGSFYVRVYASQKCGDHSNRRLRKRRRALFTEDTGKVLTVDNEFVFVVNRVG